MVHCDGRNIHSKWSADNVLHWHDEHKGDVSNEVVLILCGSARLPWFLHLLGGFWTIFLLLWWKVEKLWLRPASASIIGSVVCLPHFIVILGVTYKYDEFLIIVCGAVGKKKVIHKIWTPHQTLALLVALEVPSLALLTENWISQELFCA